MESRGGSLPGKTTGIKRKSISGSPVGDYVSLQ